MTDVSQKMLNEAMKKAVDLGMLPKVVDEETYLRNWENMRKVLQAAFDVADQTSAILPRE